MQGIDLADRSRSLTLRGQKPQRRFLSKPRAVVRLAIGFLVVVLAALSPATDYLSNDSGNAEAAGPQISAVGNVSSYREPKTVGDLARSGAIPRSPPRAGMAVALPPLERVNILSDQNGEVRLGSLPQFSTIYGSKIASLSAQDQLVYYHLDPELQKFTRDIIKKARAPHVAIVAMNPRSGEVLAVADKSTALRNLALHAGFPAASIYKLVTTTAALERSNLKALSPIRFRGGNYTLNQWNYLPSTKADRRSMSLAEALGRSVNPVFARVALNYLSPQILRQYTRQFGFNTSLQGHLPLESSAATVPDSAYNLSLTAAGFGDINLSPIHAAALMSGIANGGLLPRPLVIDRITSRDGREIYHSQPEALARIMRPETSRTLMNMMEYTVITGTSRSEFTKRGARRLPFRVAAKTGTLSGNSPEGTNHWFVAAAPIENPKLAVAVIVVNPRSGGTKASYLGRQMFEHYFK